MKCALPDCDKESSYRTLCCCPAHSRKYGGLVAKGLLPKISKPIVEPIKRGKGSNPKPYKDRTSEQQSRWISYLIERRKKRDRSMPGWANKESINEIYLQARKLTEATGIQHEVDHIIPSNHPLVCGLHVENNLQILTKKDNRTKSNYWQP